MEVQDTTDGHGFDVDPTNPEGFIEHTRREAVTKSTDSVEHQEGMTTHLLLKMCHGLIKTNQEIWKRCRPYCCKTFKMDKDSTKDKFIFYRVRHLNVRTQYGTQTLKPSYTGEEFTLKSDPHVTKLAFEIPKSFPATLEYLVPVPTPDDDDLMPNYGQILRRAMLLIDELVFMFLLGFKAFLENQQVALGSVEAWLFHDIEHQLFLQDQFGLNFNYDDSSWHRLVTRHFQYAAKCSRCGEPFGSHPKDEMEDWVTCRIDKRPGCFPLPTSKETVLFRGEFPGSIRFDLSIETPNERSCLIHFLNFLRQYKTHLTLNSYENEL